MHVAHRPLLRESLNPTVPARVCLKSLASQFPDAIPANTRLLAFQLQGDLTAEMLSVIEDVLSRRGGQWVRIGDHVRVSQRIESPVEAAEESAFDLDREENAGYVLRGDGYPIYAAVGKSAPRQRIEDIERIFFICLPSSEPDEVRAVGRFLNELGKNLRSFPPMNPVTWGLPDPKDAWASFVTDVFATSSSRRKNEMVSLLADDTAWCFEVDDFAQWSHEAIDVLSGPQRPASSLYRAQTDCLRLEGTDTDLVLHRLIFDLQSAWPSPEICGLDDPVAEINLVVSLLGQIRHVSFPLVSSLEEADLAARWNWFHGVLDKAGEEVSGDVEAHRAKHRDGIGVRDAAKDDSQDPKSADPSRDIPASETAWLKMAWKRIKENKKILDPNVSPSFEEACKLGYRKRGDNKNFNSRSCKVLKDMFPEAHQKRMKTREQKRLDTRG